MSKLKASWGPVEGGLLLMEVTQCSVGITEVADRGEMTIIEGT